jgi:hypothetical protein
MTNIITNLANSPANQGAQYQQEWLEWLKILGPYLCACLSGLLAYYFAGRRDNTNRKRAFDAFVRQWRAEIDKPSEGTGNESYVRAYRNKVNAFHGEIARVRDLYSGQFHVLTERIWNRSDEKEWHDKDPRPAITRDIDALLEIL